MMAGCSIPDAISNEATRRALSYRVEAPLTDPPECLGWSREEWDSLTPGYKREIERDLRHRGLIPDLCSPPPEKKSFKEIKDEVEYAGKKRL